MLIKECFLCHFDFHNNNNNNNLLYHLWKKSFQRQSLKLINTKKKSFEYIKEQCFGRRNMLRVLVKHGWDKVHDD